MADHAQDFVVAVARDLGNRELGEKHALAVAESIGWDVRRGFSTREAQYVADRIRALIAVPRVRASDDSGAGR